MILLEQVQAWASVSNVADKGTKSPPALGQSFIVLGYDPGNESAGLTCLGYTKGNAYLLAHYRIDMWSRDAQARTGCKDFWKAIYDCEEQVLKFSRKHGLGHFDDEGALKKKFYLFAERTNMGAKMFNSAVSQAETVGQIKRGLIDTFDIDRRFCYPTPLYDWHTLLFKKGSKKKSSDELKAYTLAKAKEWHLDTECHDVADSYMIALYGLKEKLCPLLDVVI